MPFEYANFHAASECISCHLHIRRCHDNSSSLGPRSVWISYKGVTGYSLQTLWPSVDRVRCSRRFRKGVSDIQNQKQSDEDALHWMTLHKSPKLFGVGSEEAFLNVPLFKAVFEKYREGALQPSAALERDIAGWVSSPSIFAREVV
jgi:hypothetical protein